MALFSEYVTDTRELIRDRGGLWNSQATMTRWINQARRKTAEVTGCLRALVTGQAPFGSGAQPSSAVPGGMVPGMVPNANSNAVLNAPTNSFATIQGQEMYPYRFAAPFLRKQYAGFDLVNDVASVAVSWGGASMPTLDWMPFDDFQAYCRAAFNTAVQFYPSIWSNNGDGVNQNMFLFPIPPQQLIMQWDCFCLPTNIYSDNDYDSIPSPFSSGVKFYAAGLCFMSSQRFGMAEIMLEEFKSTLGIGRVASDRGKTPSFYM